MIAVHLIKHLASLTGRVNFDAQLYRGERVQDFARRVMPADWNVPVEPGRVHVVLNGEPLTPEQWSMPLMDEDDLVLAPIPGGPLAALPALFSLKAILTAVITTIVATAISTAISMLLAKRPPKQVRGQEDSAWNAWDGEQQQFGVGFPIGIGFGTEKVAGQVLQSFRRASVAGGGGALQPVAGSDRLFMLLSFGDGPITSIAGYADDEFTDEPPSIFTPGLIKVNDNDLTQQLYPEARFSGRLGFEQQSAIDGFHNIHTEYTVDAGLTQDEPPVATTLYANTFLPFYTLLPVSNMTGIAVNNRLVVDAGLGSQREYVVQRFLHTGPVITRTFVSYSGGFGGTVTVDTTSGLVAGDVVTINANAATSELFRIQAILTGTTFSIDLPIIPQFTHFAGEPVQVRPIIETQTSVGTHAVGAAVCKIGVQILKDVVYTTVASGNQFSRDQADTALAIRMRFDACFSQSSSGAINTHRVDFRVSDRVRGGGQ